VRVKSTAIGERTGYGRFILLRDGALHSRMVDAVGQKGCPSARQLGDSAFVGVVGHRSGEAGEPTEKAEERKRRGMVGNWGLW